MHPFLAFLASVWSSRDVLILVHQQGISLEDWSYQQTETLSSGLGLRPDRTFASFFFCMLLLVFLSFFLWSLFMFLLFPFPFSFFSSVHIIPWVCPWCDRYLGVAVHKPQLVSTVSLTDRSGMIDLPTISYLLFVFSHLDVFCYCLFCDHRRECRELMWEHHHRIHVSWRPTFVQCSQQSQPLQYHRKREYSQPVASRVCPRPSEKLWYERARLLPDWGGCLLYAVPVPDLYTNTSYSPPFLRMSLRWTVTVKIRKGKGENVFINNTFT